MPHTIALKRSSVPGKVPLVTDLKYGEIAVNTADGKMYMKINNGVERIVAFFNVEYLSGPVDFEYPAEYTVEFTYTDTHKTVVLSTPPHILVENVRIAITQPFDQATTLVVGDLSNPAKFVDLGDTDLTRDASYIVYPNLQYFVPTTFTMDLNAGASSQGTGILTIALKSLA